MATKHVFSMSAIMTFFKDHSKQFERGENSYSSGHVFEFRCDPEIHPALIRGKVEASMKTKKYDVEVSVDLRQNTIIQATCTCPRGQVVCHHMAALCIYAYHNVSSTDTACTWSIPGPSRAEPTMKLSKIYPRSNPQYQAVQRIATDAEIQRFKNDLSGNIVGFSWLLQPEPSKEAFIVPQIEDILLSDTFLNISDKSKYLLEKCSVDVTTCNTIVEATKGQATNPNWLLARKYRLTASKFAAVLCACQRGKFSDAFFKNLLEGYNLDGIKAIQWGTHHEKVALEEFTLATGMSVESTGLWLHPCGFLGASPDGIVEDKLVEVKCPYKFRNDKLSEILETHKSYIIYKNNGATVLNTNHDYFHQIQGQLHLCNKASCFLVVWTPQETEIINIERDPDWATNLDILINFYLDKFIPHILGK